MFTIVRVIYFVADARAIFVIAYNCVLFFSLFPLFMCYVCVCFFVSV